MPEACLSSVRSALAAAGVSSILQAKILHQRSQRDGGFARATVSLQGCSAQVRVFQVIEALIDQFT